MIITVISEPRSGSTNLANWFYFREDFTVFFEPLTNPRQKWYQGNKPPSEWSYSTPHFLVKEVYGNGLMFQELLSISDKVILLYRENTAEQVASWLNCKTTNNWHLPWMFRAIENEKEEESFLELKQGFKEKYLDKDYFRVSYEDLYYKKGFQKVVDYLGIEGLRNEQFPYGKRYRVDVAPSKKVKLL